MGQVSRVSDFFGQHTSLVSTPPVLEMSGTTLHSQARRFINGFPGETSYAVKANSEACIISELVKAGITTFDVASPLEMQIVRNILPQATLHYHNPVRSSQEVAIALHAYGCRRFSVDHMDDLEVLSSAGVQPGEIEIAIRFRMETINKAVQSFKSKFGILRDEAILLLDVASRMGFKTGLTFHPGSQTLSPTSYLEHIKEAARISRQAERQIAFLNVGGGFPSSYKGLEAQPLSCFFSKIRTCLEVQFGDQPPRLECEPGRALVARAGTLITTIKVARHDRAELYLNDGIYGGLMEFYQFPDLAPHYSCLSKADTEKMDWTVYGPTCDPVDCLPARLNLPKSLKEGDQIRFHGVGAYSTATATRFNGYGAIAVRMV